MTPVERACASGYAFLACCYGYGLVLALCWWLGRRA